MLPKFRVLCDEVHGTIGLTALKKSRYPIKYHTIIIVKLSFFTLALLGCGAGTANQSSTNVTITWKPNLEADVNSPGGGYKVAISGQPTIDVPFPQAPTIAIKLKSGNYTAVVTAYSAIDPMTGSQSRGANSSLPSSNIAIAVP